MKIAKYIFLLHNDLDRLLFKTKRHEHHQVIQTLGKMPTDVKRYKAVQMLLDQVFKVVENVENPNQIEQSSFRFSMTADWH